MNNRQRGEDNVNAALKDAQVFEARVVYDSRKRSVRELASAMGASRSVLYRALKGETYRDAGGPTASPRQMPMRGEAHGRARTTRETVVEMRSLYAKGGVTFAEVARRFGHPFGTVSSILRFQTWADAGGPRRGVILRRNNLSDADVVRMRHAYHDDHVSGVELAQQYKVSKSYVCMLVNGRLRPNAGGPMAPLCQLPKLADVAAASAGPTEWADLVKLGPGRRVIARGEVIDDLSQADFDLVRSLRDAGPDGLSGSTLIAEQGGDAVKRFHRLRQRGDALGSVLKKPQRRGPKRDGNNIPEDNYRIG
jgi:hypothetical protein